MLILESFLSLPQTLQYHETLNPAIWDHEGEMKPDVRQALLHIADNFIESLEPSITKGMVKDVCLTGSNANFNYTQGSDCDLHVMIDYPHKDSKLFEDFAQAKKTVWNNQYKVSIHGFPVEIYPQNANEGIVKGSGWFSITKNEWISRPTHESVDVNNPSIIHAANKVAKQIDFVLEYKVTDLSVLHRLGQKIWGLRDQQKNGEFSVNNLAFKELRNSGYTDKYIKYMQDIQNKSLSVE